MEVHEEISWGGGSNSPNQAFTLFGLRLEKKPNSHNLS